MVHHDTEQLLSQRRSFQQASIESTAQPPAKKAKPNNRPPSTDPPAIHPFFVSAHSSNAESVASSKIPRRTGNGSEVVQSDAGNIVAAEKKGAKARSSTTTQGKHKGMKPFTFIERDLQGIGMICHIAGARSDGLRYLLDKCAHEDTSVSISLICADEHLTSNLDNTTVKYCTPAVHCTGCSWACDRAPRASKATGTMLGAVIVVRTGASAGEESSSFTTLSA